MSGGMGGGVSYDSITSRATDSLLNINNVHEVHVNETRDLKSFKGR